MIERDGESLTRPRRAGPDITARPAPESGVALYTPPTAEQLDAITRLLGHDSDPDRVATLLHAISRRPVESSPRADEDAGTDPDLAALRALRRPPHRDLPAALLRIARAIDAETEPLYHRQDCGHLDTAPALRAIAFRVLELGFTIAEQAGIDAHTIERAVAQAFALPGYR